MAALIVEDGSAKVDANSYLSVVDADTYHALHNNPEWSDTYDLEDKIGALAYATAFLDASFRWIGILQNAQQSLGWPRVMGFAYVDLFTEEGRLVPAFPQAIKDATAEVARVHLKVSPLNRVKKPDSDVSDLTVGPIRIAFDRSSQGVQDWGFLLGMLRYYYRWTYIGRGLRSAPMVRG